MASSNKRSFSPDSGLSGRPAKRARLSYADNIESIRQQLTEDAAALMKSIVRDQSVNNADEAAQLAFKVADAQFHFHNNVCYFYPPDDMVGEIIGMGSNDCKELALGNSDDDDAEIIDEYPPTFIPNTNFPSYNKIKQISCGGNFSCALTTDGEVYSWGCPDEGALGRGVLNDEEMERIGKVNNLENIVQIAAGDTHCLFLDIKGEVYFTGLYYTSEYGKWQESNASVNFVDENPNMDPVLLKRFPQKVMKLAAGKNFSAALLEDGQTLVTWGIAFNGQLARSKSQGAPIIETNECDSEGNEGEAYQTYLLEGTSLMGEEMVVKDDNGQPEKDHEGKIISKFKVCKDRLYENFLVPKPVEWFEGPPASNRQIMDFCCGEAHILVVARDEGSFDSCVYSAGRNHNGQLGQSDQKAYHALKKIVFFDNKHVRKVTAGAYHSLALNVMGDVVWGFGYTMDGQLGLFDGEGPKADRTIKTPRQISFPRSILEQRIVDIECGDNTSFAITYTGEIYSWGFNVRGQAGIDFKIGEAIHRPTNFDPMESAKFNSPGASKCRVLRAAGGGQHSLLLVKLYK